MKQIKIINEDCMEFMKKLEDESIDLIVTDPPYKVTARGRGGKGTTTSGGMLKSELSCKGKIFRQNDIPPEKYIPEFYRILKEGTHCYVMTNHVNLLKMLTVADKVGFHFIKSIIWNKGNKIMSQAYMSQFEYILFFRKGKFKKINNCGTSDILDISNKKTKGENGQNLHDTEKPVELMKILIENSTSVEDIVYDPFMGIGAVPLACRELNRGCLATEIDEEFFDIAAKRIKY